MFCGDNMAYSRLGTTRLLPWGSSLWKSLLLASHSDGAVHHCSPPRAITKMVSVLGFRIQGLQASGFNLGLAV